MLSSLFGQERVTPTLSQTQKRKVPFSFHTSRLMEPPTKDAAVGKTVVEWFQAYEPVLSRFVFHKQDLVIEEPIRCFGASRPGKDVSLRLELSFHDSLLIDDTATILLVDKTNGVSLGEKTVVLHGPGKTRYKLTTLQKLVQWAYGECESKGRT